MNADIYDTFFSSATQGWAVGLNGTILLYSGGVPTLTVTDTPTAFTACAGTASAQQSFNVSGSNLTSNITVTAPTA